MPRTAPPDPAQETKSAKRTPHHARRLRSHRVARAIGLTTTAALAFAGGAAATVLGGLSTGETIKDTSVQATDLRTPDPNDPFAGNALNILVVGTDMRDAENAAIAGDADGVGSDTTLLVHVSGDRSWIEVVSIPRDSLVSIPACNLPDGTMSSPRKGAMFNSAFAIGANGFNPMTSTDEEKTDALNHAVGCTKTTVESLTKVPVTNTILVQMTGVIGVVDAMNGVTMCFDEPVVGSKQHSPGLNLPAGQYTLNGFEAIEFLRARHGKGMGLADGSDLKRIERQQAFIDSAMGQLLAGGVLANVPELHGVLGEVLKSISADEALDSVTDLSGLAFSLRNVDTSRIVFSSVPVVTAPSNKNRVVWTSEADAIWERLGTDQLPPALAPTEEPVDQGDAGAGTATPPPDSSTGGDGAVETGGTDPAPTDPDPAPADTFPPDPVVEATPPPGWLPGVCYEGWTPSGS